MPKRAQPHDTAQSDDLQGLDILVVEELARCRRCAQGPVRTSGANAGPAPTVADAEALLADVSPEVAIVDIHLRGGEHSNPLIAGLNEQGVPVIVLTGSSDFPRVPLAGATAILEKPVSSRCFSRTCDGQKGGSVGVQSDQMKAM